MVPRKLNETRKKLSLVGYKQTYTQGSYIPVFAKEGPHTSGIRVEASPVWNGIIEKQNLGDENLVSYEPIFLTLSCFSFFEQFQILSS